jgi:hypothetical protein
MQATGSFSAVRSGFASTPSFDKDHGTFNQILKLTDVACHEYDANAERVRGGICWIGLPIWPEQSFTKCVTKGTMSSRRSRKGGSQRGNTFRR